MSATGGPDHIAQDATVTLSWDTFGSGAAQAVLIEDKTTHVLLTPEPVGNRATLQVEITGPTKYGLSLDGPRGHAHHVQQVNVGEVELALSVAPYGDGVPVGY